MRNVMLFLLCSLSLAAFFFAGCGQPPRAEQDAEMTRLQEEVRTLQGKVVQLEEENASLRKNAPAPVAMPGASGSAPPPTAPSETTAAPPAPTGAPMGFTDIKGLFAETAITRMASLEVFDDTGGAFRPHDPITRAEFVRWLVRANNRYFQSKPDKQIRLAEAGESSFTDVQPGHPDYRYIQGMANAGFVIGYDEKTFKPDKFLSREEMIAIKVGPDGALGAQNPSFHDVAGKFSDARSISKKYYKAIFYDTFSPGQNIPRVFGKLKTFNPQKEVTRAEAALCLEQIGYGSAGKTMKGD